MATEIRRQLFRIAPNYARLGATLLIGIVLTQVQFAWLGSDGFGMVALLGATLGLGSLFQDLTRQSLIRELGAAHHAAGDEFLRVYNSTYVICAGAAALTAIALGVILLAIPYLEIPPKFVGPGRALIAGEGAAILLTILLAPAFNMFVVAEHFFTHNLYTTLQRMNYLIAAVVLFYVFKITDPVLGITLFGVVPAALNIVLLTGFVIVSMVRDRRLIPRVRWVDWGTVRGVTTTFGWNSGVILAISLHERLAALIMNLAFGLWGNTVFGLALRLVSYVRMVTLGMTFGVDAVSARIASENDTQRMRRLIEHSTRLHAFTALPGAVAVWVLAEPLLTLWIGRYLDDPAAYIPQAVVLIRIMTIGLAGRAISDGWIRILYGAGHVKKYAPVILFGGLINPVIAGVLLLTLPDSIRYTAVGWGYTAVFMTIHFIVLPMIGARALKLDFKAFMLPVGRPALCAAIASPTLLLTANEVQSNGGWTLSWVGIAAAGYAVIYGICVALIVLRPDDRARLMGTLKRALRR